MSQKIVSQDMVFQNKNSGFSLIELIVALTILALISLGIGSSFFQMAKNQQQTIKKTDTTNFYNMISLYAGSEEFCNNSLKGIKLTGTKQPIKFNQSLINHSKDLKKGDSLPGSHNIRIRDIDLEASAAAAAKQSVRYAGADAESHLAKLTFSLETTSANDPNIWDPQPDHTVVVPVVSDLAGIILDCGPDTSSQNHCEAIGGIWNPTGGANGKGVCKPSGDSCHNQGSYVEWTCQGVRGDHPNVCGSNLMSFYSGIVRNSPQKIVRLSGTHGGVTNPTTQTLNCQSGFTRMHTGMDTYTYTLSAGKKKSYNVHQYTNFYTCMKCN